MIRFGINLIVLCEWLLSVVLFVCLWKLLTVSHAALIIRGILLAVSLGALAIASALSGLWLIRLDKRGWYSSNLLGAFLFLLSWVLLVWVERGGLPPKYDQAAGAVGLIVLACVIPSTFGLILLNLPKTRQLLTKTERVET